jgi:outer membrane immunogenic protein
MQFPIRYLSYCCLLVSAGALADEASYSWTGAYGGANLGVIWSGSQLKASHPSLLNSTSSYDTELDSADVNPGLQFGYSYQLDSHWVLGGEADFTYPSAESQYTFVNETGTAFDHYRVHNNLQGSLRLRLGYAIDRLLPYFTAGVSWASLGLDYENDKLNAYSQRTAQTGWVLGAGMEYGFLDNLSARFEYLYTDYGSALNMDTPTISGSTDSLSAAHANLFTNVMRAGINFRF